MARILILFASSDPSTARIAERIGERLRESRHSVLLQPAGESPAPVGDCDAVLIGNAIRQGKLARGLDAWIRAEHPALAERWTAFFAVCVGPGAPGIESDAAKARIEEFLVRTEWKPGLTARFAESTDWTAVDRFAAEFASRLGQERSAIAAG